jgi:hypothetical protein
MRKLLSIAILAGAVLAGSGCASTDAPPDSQGNVLWKCDQIHCSETRMAPPSPPPWCCEKRMVRHKSSELR